MRAYFKPAQRNETTPHTAPRPPLVPLSSTETRRMDLTDTPSDCEAGTMGGRLESGEIFTGYLSDISDDESMPEDADHEDNEKEDEEVGIPATNEASESLFPICAPPPLKRRRLEVPARVKIQKAREERQKKLVLALDDIEKLVRSKQDIFEAGRNGLQSYRARAIQSYLWMVVHNKRNGMTASKIAAESQGFAANWGSRTVRKWVRHWINDRALPISARGRHTKSFSLISDPAIRAELRSFVRSNKWAMDPAKLVEFSQQRMVPEAAKKYLEKIVTDEMPRGLKRYMELELFPRIQLKVGKGVSLQTARRFLYREGFRYTEHKKSLYYDGHERPDVVDYRQKVFLPAMKKHRERLVEYVVGDVDREASKPSNFVERRLVLVAHDEMTVQAHDGKKKSWVMDNEHALKKKGVGRGMHHSEVICSTVGWLKEAGQDLEYGKNYDGYWTGELFVKQVS